MMEQQSPAPRTLCDQGLALHRSGRLEDARRCYDEVLRRDPAHFDALYLLGTLYGQAGHSELAVGFLNRAIAINPNVPAAYGVLGVALIELERPADALEILGKAITLDPAYADAHYSRALALSRLARPQEALASYDAAIALWPEHVEANNNRGVILVGFGRAEEALASYDVAIRLRPDYAEAHNNRAAALHSLGHNQDSLDSCDKALALRRDYAMAHYNRGIALFALNRPREALASYDAAIALQRDEWRPHHGRGLALSALGRHQDAVASLDRAIALAPGFAGAHADRGAALGELGRHEEALASYAQAVALDPGDARALKGHGFALHDLKRHEEALASLDRAIALRPDYLEAHNNRGSALYELGRLDEALASYEAAIALNPDHVDVRTNRSATLLLAGRFEAGWREFEWRKKTWTLPSQQFDPQRAWLDETSLDGKRLFVHHEQGLGDTIQFSRYIDLLRASGHDVVFSVQAPLKSLLRQVAPTSEILVGDERPGRFDYHCSLMSLPLAFGTTLRSIPAPRYLYADQARRTSFDAMLAPRSRPRVGLAWSGNPAHANDSNRSIALERLTPMLGAGVDWVSLQKEVRPGDAEALLAGGRVRFLGPALRDFADTAALLDLMDLVITVDTSIAHLAGAMGKAVWILLPFRPDWRWMLERRDSPWYPSARLFRQPRIGDWAAVIEAVGAELLARFA